MDMSMSSMSMTMSMSGSPTSTMSGMGMASMTGDMMHTSDGMMMGMDSMAMVFFTSTATPLFSMSWTPESTGQYAGTCIFLIIFAAILRALLATRVRIHEIMAIVKRHRNAGMGRAYPHNIQTGTRPWRVGEAVTIASLDVLLVGVSYLLMIAVMTMNVGYFMSVLAGVFVGSMLTGHYMPNAAAH